MKSAPSSLMPNENPDLAAPLIQRSWQRSLEHKVNPQRIEDNDILPTHLFRDRSNQAEALLHAAQPVLSFLLNFLKGRSHVILLSDQDAYILESLGDPSFLTKTQSIYLSPGASWRETVKGTNAIGTALVEKAPVRVIGAEHFVRENHFLGCWAAPILGHDGHTIGILDISSQASRSKDRLLDLVVSGARMIEYNLRLLAYEQYFRHNTEARQLIARLAVSQELTLDRQGIITQITPTAASSLKIAPETAIGSFIGDILSPHFAFSLHTSPTPQSDLNNLLTPSPTPSQLSAPVPAHGSAISPVQTEPPNKVIAVGPTATVPQPQTSREAALTASPSQVPSPHYPEPLATPLWVGSSEASRKVLQRAAKVAATQTTILLQGESGTGKEIIARHIHLLSPRRDGPYVALNCSALPDSLIESELFGYDDGAFTGAKRGGKPGKFELAQGGTIFLDEIGDISPNVQVALLRVLQEKEIYRIGSGKAQPLNVRVIAATHRDLARLVHEGKFRLDLYYRLKVITLDLPPLRERIQDLFDLVPHFTAKFSHGGQPYRVAREVYSTFLAHPWPGNVRELENCIESMCALADGPQLTVVDLPPELEPSVADLPSKSVPIAADLPPKPAPSVADQYPVPVSAPRPVTGNQGLLRLQTRELISDALNRTGGKIAPAARLLGIGRNTLYRKIKELDITNF